MNIHNLKKKILGIFRKKKKVTCYVTKEELYKAFSSLDEYNKFINDIYLKIEEEMYKDVKQEIKNNNLPFGKILEGGF